MHNRTWCMAVGFECSPGCSTKSQIFEPDCRVTTLLQRSAPQWRLAARPVLAVVNATEFASRVCESRVSCHYFYACTLLSHPYTVTTIPLSSQLARNMYKKVQVNIRRHADQVVSRSRYRCGQLLKETHTVYRFTSFVTTPKIHLMRQLLQQGSPSTCHHFWRVSLWLTCISLSKIYLYRHRNVHKDILLPNNTIRISQLLMKAQTANTHLWASHSLHWSHSSLTSELVIVVQGTALAVTQYHHQAWPSLIQAKLVQWNYCSTTSAGMST